MKRVIKSVTLVAILLFVMLQAASCKSVPAVEAEFELGYDGVVKISEGNPLKAKINNMGEGFSGELQIEIHKDGGNKVIFAKAFEMAPNSEKEIDLYTPIYTIQKNFVVSIVADGKKIYSEAIVPKRFISPDHTVIAVVTDQADDYRFFNNLELPNYNVDQEFYGKYQQSMSSSSFGGSSMTTTATLEVPEEEFQKTHILYFDSFSELSDQANYDFMDYIYIGDATNLNITSDIEAYIIEWMKLGNTLFIETGADYKKVMSQLPRSLINYDIVESDTKYFESIAYGIEINDNISVAQGHINKDVGGDTLVIEDINYGVSTMFGQGNLITLTMDLGDEPFKDHSSGNLLLASIVDIVNFSGDKDLYAQNNYNYDMQYRLGRIPTEKEPPYYLMVIIFLLYIAVVGPIIYAVFKRIDQRDKLWIAIPAASFVCLIVLYLVGFTTRYTKPITNSISSIEYTDGESYIDVTTELALFNNKNEDVKISWPQTEAIEFASSNDYYYDGPKDNKKLVGKMLIGEKHEYTQYDSPLWTPSYMMGHKVIPFETEFDGDMIRVVIIDDEMTFEVTNKTPLDLEYAFLMFGNSMYKIGDFKAYETVTLTDGYTGDVYQFFDTEMAPGLYNDYTAEGRKKQADIDLLRERTENSYYQNMNQISTNMEAKIYGINRDSIGYEIDINNAETEDFSKNIVTISGEINYVSGETIRLPHGSIQATYNYDNQGGKGDFYMNQDHQFGMIAEMYELREAELLYYIPEFIDIEELEFNIGGIYEQMKFYDVYNGYETSQPLKSTFSIFNVVTGDYDVIEFTEDATDLISTIVLDATDYIEVDSGAVILRFEVYPDNDTFDNVYKMTVPTISVKGVVK